MEEESEYHDAMIKMLELIWGEGFMAPGGVGNIEKVVDGLDLRDKRVLDIGCGIGGPAFLLAEKYGAHVVAIDIAPHLIDLARQRAQTRGLERRTEFRTVEPGPLEFPSESFDVVLSSGAFTQIEDKRGLFGECLRVLRSGGILTSYEWMKCEGEYSADMRYFFEMEGLTYALETPERYEEILRETGFTHIELDDRSEWYRSQSMAELEKIKSELYPHMLESMGKEHADHFVENWRAMAVVCGKGEMLQVYSRAQKPG